MLEDKKTKKEPNIFLKCWWWEDGNVPWITITQTQPSYFISKEGRDVDERAKEGLLDEGLGVTFSELYKSGQQQGLNREPRIMICCAALVHASEATLPKRRMNPMVVNPGVLCKQSVGIKLVS